MREKQKQKRKRKMGREGRKTIGTFVERKREALISLREGRRVKTMRGEVYISGKPNRVSYARMRSHGPFKYHRPLDRARFIFPPPPRLQKSFTICSVASASTDQIWFVSPSLPPVKRSVESIFFFFSELRIVYTSFEDLSYFFFSTITRYEEKVYKWS